MIRALKMMGGALLAAALVACGGGGGSSGTTTNGSKPSTVADFTLATDKSQLDTTGTETATLTVVALDASRNVVASAPVTVSANNGGVFTPAAASTDGSGTYTGTLSIGTDKTERDLTLTVTINGVVKTVTVHVVAKSADFALFLDKTTITNVGSDTAILTVVALDASRNVVAGAPVTVSVNNGGVFTPASTSTDAAGTYTGTLSIGTDKTERDLTLTVTINGVVKTATVHVAAKNTDFALFLDKTTITNVGSDTATLTVLALDSSRNVVPGAAVAVSVNQNGVFTPTGSVTDSKGIYTGTVGIGADKRDRDITLTVTVDGKTRQTVVHVAGTKITLQATPNAPSPGQTVQLSIGVTDASGNAIPSASVSMGGTVVGLAGRILTTNAAGVAATNFVAPTGSGFYTINATTNGATSSDYQLQVFSSAVPAAVIPTGSVPSLAAAPNVLSVNAVGSTTNRTTLRFLFLDAQNQPIQNVRVRFVDATVGLPGVGAVISSGSSTLYTNAAGTVSTEYISGQNSSPTNGVTVRACYSANDFASSTDCPASVVSTLTVAGQALSVSVGDDNFMTKGSGQITYIKRFAVTIADSAGRAVADAPVDISVDLTHYAKGQFAYGYALSDVPISMTAAYPDTTTSPASILRRVWCPNEDTNRNGNVDPGENINASVDSNNQPTLEPRKSDLLISYDSPTVTRTDSNGVLLIKVEYSQRFGTWLAYKVRVTANVSGSQGMAERLFVTDVLAADVNNGSFLTPPYGVGACTSPN